MSLASFCQSRLSTAPHGAVCGRVCPELIVHAAAMQLLAVATGREAMPVFEGARAAAGSLYPEPPRSTPPEEYLPLYQRALLLMKALLSDPEHELGGTDRGRLLAQCAAVGPRRAAPSAEGRLV